MVLDPIEIALRRGHHGFARRARRLRNGRFGRSVGHQRFGVEHAIHFLSDHQLAFGDLFVDDANAQRGDAGGVALFDVPEVDRLSVHRVDVAPLDFAERAVAVFHKPSPGATTFEFSV